MASENKSKVWSPWGDRPANSGFLKLPPEIPQVLGSMGFGHAEIIVVLGIFSAVRPEGHTASVSQTFLSSYANCNSRTVRRAIKRMLEYGAVVSSSGLLCKTPSTYELSKFKQSIDKVLESRNQNGY